MKLDNYVYFLVGGLCGVASTYTGFITMCLVNIIVLLILQRIFNET